MLAFWPNRVLLNLAIAAEPSTPGEYIKPQSVLRCSLIATHSITFQRSPAHSNLFQLTPPLPRLHMS